MAAHGSAAVTPPPTSESMVVPLLAATKHTPPLPSPAAAPRSLNSCAILTLTILGHYLTLCRGLSAVVSAFGIELALNNFLGNIPGVNTQSDAVFGPIAFVIFVTFIGMATSSLFAQGFRLKQTIDEIKDGKFHLDLCKIPLPTLASTVLYSGQIFYNTHGSCNNFLTKFLPSVLERLGTGPIEVPAKIALPIGFFIALGYALITFNYNSAGVISYAEKKQKGSAPQIRWRQFFLFLVANLLPQLMINSLITTETFFADDSSSSLSRTNSFLISLGLSLFTGLGLYATQFCSFAENTAVKKGGIPNLYKSAVAHNIRLPKDGLSSCVKYSFYGLSALCNIGVLMMIPSSSGAFASAPGFLFPLSTQTTRIAYFIAFASSLLLTVTQAGGYMAFNTIPGKLALLFWLRTRHLPSKKQMIYIENLVKLEAKMVMTKPLPGETEPALTSEQKEKYGPILSKAWRFIAKNNLAAIDRIIDGAQTSFDGKKEAAKAASSALDLVVVEADAKRAATTSLTGGAMATSSESSSDSSSPKKTNGSTPSFGLTLLDTFDECQKSLSVAQIASATDASHVPTPHTNGYALLSDGTAGDHPLPRRGMTTRTAEVAGRVIMPGLGGVAADGVSAAGLAAGSITKPRTRGRRASDASHTSSMGSYRPPINGSTAFAAGIVVPMSPRSSPSGRDGNTATAGGYGILLEL